MANCIRLFVFFIRDHDKCFDGSDAYKTIPSFTATYSPEVQPHPQPFVEAHNATYHGSGPREEARAMCSVRTQEVNATANATITRRIHGVVTSRELHTAVLRLEVIIYGQMQQMWRSVDALRAELVGSPDLRSSASAYPPRNTVSFRYKPHSPHGL